jgi:F-type H+-transporting ATPase subunit gamma
MQDSPTRAGRVEIVGEHLNLLGKLDYEEVNEIVQRLVASYMREEFDSVYVIYNEFKSVIAQRLVAQRILPVQEIGRREVALAEEFTLEERERMGEAARAAGISLQEQPKTEAERRTEGVPSPEVDYIYEQTPEELFRAMLPRYVSLELFQAMLESVAAEHAARMTAMDSATSNASEMIDSLTLTMNRVRQAAITKEIIEIVSGAAAL